MDIEGSTTTPPSRPLRQGAALRQAGAVLHLTAVPTRSAAAAATASPWDARALQQLFQSRLHDAQVIVASNRAPWSHQRIDGEIRAVRPASGLVTAVEPVLHACNGTWVAHGGGTADREVVDANDVWRVPALPGGDGYALRRIWLSDAERAGHGDGLSNGGLWPLCHMAHAKPRFVESDWAHYRAVNQRFAKAVVDEARQRNPIVLVQDYHLALLPAMVREQLPRATIVSFWHVPWGHPEQMQACPWLDDLVGGLIGSDIVGFQTEQHRRNFVVSAALCGHPLQGPVLAPRSQAARHAWQARSYPISVAWPTPAEVLAQPAVTHCRQRALRQWSVPAEGKLVVGVDRFDYTKGLLERLWAIEQLLLDQPRWQGRLRFVQVAAPTRECVPEYAALRKAVTAEVKRINRRFGSSSRAGIAAPIVMLAAQHDKAAVSALYRAADVCLVTSLHDGMNLVAKEFVAARDDQRGVLVLSRFTGAAQELQQSLLVNPYDTAQVAQALHRALDMPADEQQLRMRALRKTVQFANVHRWAANMLLDAAAVREERAPSRRMQGGMAAGGAAAAGS